MIKQKIVNVDVTETRFETFIEMKVNFHSLDTEKMLKIPALEFIVG